MDKLISLALDIGFTNAAPLNVATLRFLPEVRNMCAADKCNKYDKCWSCPPGCGTLEDISGKAAAFSRGILLQSTGELEDDFDVETMMDTAVIQRDRFFSFVEAMRKSYPACLPMASGACDVCEKCTYPNTPCRFPEKAIPSMEAYGLVVSDVCTGSDVKYYYGPKTITYTSCILF